MDSGAVLGENMKILQALTSPQAKPFNVWNTAASRVQSESGLRASGVQLVTQARTKFVFTNALCPLRALKWIQIPEDLFEPLSTSHATSDAV